MTRNKLIILHILRKDLARIMSKKIMAFALALVILFLVGSVVAAPRMELKEKVFDFGYAPQNSKLSHIFWLYSTGDDTLKILNVKPG